MTPAQIKALAARLSRKLHFASKGEKGHGHPFDTCPMRDCREAREALASPAQHGDAGLREPTCAEHGDQLVCLACEQEESARPEWQPRACAGKSHVSAPGETRCVCGKYDSAAPLAHGDAGLRAFIKQCATDMREAAHIWRAGHDNEPKALLCESHAVKFDAVLALLDAPPTVAQARPAREPFDVSALVAAIQDELFTNGAGLPAVRLQMCGYGNTDLGGWNKLGASEAIKRAVARLYPPTAAEGKQP